MWSPAWTQFWTQFRVCLWKTYLLKWRKPALWLAQFAVPVVLLSIIIVFHRMSASSPMETCYFRSRANPSVGFAPFVQSLVCNIRNDCQRGNHLHQDRSYDPLNIPTYPNSSLADFVAESRPLLKSSDLAEAVDHFPEVRDLMTSLARSLISNQDLMTFLSDEMRLSEAFVDSNRLVSFLSVYNHILSGPEAQWFFQETRLNSTGIVLDLMALLGIGLHGADQNTTGSESGSRQSRFTLFRCDPEQIAGLLVSPNHDVDEDVMRLRLSLDLCNLSSTQLADFMVASYRSLKLSSLIRVAFDTIEGVADYGVQQALQDIGRIITDMVWWYNNNSTRSRTTKQELLIEPPDFSNVTSGLLTVMQCWLNLTEGLETSEICSKSPPIKLMLDMTKIFEEAGPYAEEMVSKLTKLSPAIGWLVEKTPMISKQILKGLISSFQCLQINSSAYCSSPDGLIREILDELGAGFRPKVEIPSPSELLNFLRCRLHTTQLPWDPDAHAGCDTSSPSLLEQASEIALYLKSVEQSFGLVSELESLSPAWQRIVDYLSLNIPLFQKYSDLLLLTPSSEGPCLGPNCLLDEIKSDLMEAGLSSGASESLVEGHLSINRLATFSADLPSNAISDRAEFSRLFGLPNPGSYEAVGYEVALHSNSSKVLDILNHPLNRAHIINELNHWRKQKFYEFGWLPPSLALLDMMAKNLVAFFDAIQQLLEYSENGDSATDVSNRTDFHGREGVWKSLKVDTYRPIQTIATSLTLGFDQVDVAVGNTAGDFVAALRMAFNNTVTSDLLRNLVLQPPLYKVFELGYIFEASSKSSKKSPPKSPLADFLEEDLNYTGDQTWTVSRLLLKLNEIVSRILQNLSNEGTGEGGRPSFPELICSWEVASRYLIAASNSSGSLPSAPEVVDKLCKMAGQELLGLIEILYEEFRIEDIAEATVTLSPDSVLALANMTEYTAQVAVDSLFRGLEACNTELRPNIEAVLNILENAFQDKNSSGVNLTSTFVCGEENMFVIGDINLASIAGTVAQHNGSNANSSALESSPCDRLKESLTTDTAGKVLWGLISPLIRGKIIYVSPPEIDDLVERIVAETNHTFTSIQEGTIQILRFVDLAGEIQQLSSLQEELEILLDFLCTKLVQEVILAKTSLDPEVIQSWNASDIVAGFEAQKGFFKTAEMAADFLHCLTFDRFQKVYSEQELFQKAVEGENNQTFLAGLVFLNEGDSRRHVKYKLQMSRGAMADTDLLKYPYYAPGPKASFLGDLRDLLGFLQIQEAVDRAIIKTVVQDHTGHDCREDLAKVGIFTQQFPYPCYSVDWFLNNLTKSQMTQLLLILSLLATMMTATRHQLSEKESLNMQMLQTIGAKKVVLWSTWLLAWFIDTLLVSCCTCLMLTFGLFLTMSSGVLVFALLLNFGLACLTFCFMMCAILEKARSGIVVTTVLYVAGMVPSIYVISSLMKGEAFSVIGQTISAWCFPSVFGLAFYYVNELESRGVGIQLDNTHSTFEDHSYFNFAYWNMVLVANSVVHCLVAALFLVLKQRRPAKDFATPATPVHCFSYTPLDEIASSGSEAKKVVRLRKLTKEYIVKGDQVRRAVTDLSVTFAVGEVSALLGHNGAGKSTIIKMLTGSESPTSGEVSILGRDVSSAKHLMGLCPQQSILYDTLTVAEHLTLSCHLKKSLSDSRDRDASTEVNRFMKSLGIEDQANVQVGLLSEGMRRRVCVCLAFIGGSKVIVLDEPTSGVDPVARRYIWDLVTAFRHDRTIIFTTHHLDEAEVLSDKIVVVHNGRLLAQGSTASLGATLGTGYELSIKLRKQPEDLADGNNRAGSLDQVVTMVRSLVPEARISPPLGSEPSVLKVQLPWDLINDETQEGRSRTDSVCQLMASLQAGPDQVHIEDYCITSTSLEEIFMGLLHSANSYGLRTSGLKDVPVSKEDCIGDLHQVGQRPLNLASRFYCCDDNSSFKSHVGCEEVQLYRGRRLLASQIAGLLLKRVHHFRRDLNFAVSSFLMPTLLLVVALLAQSFNVIRTAPSAVILNPAVYGPQSVSFVNYSSDAEGHEILRALTDYGIGTSCTPDYQASHLNTLSAYKTPSCRVSGNNESLTFVQDYEGPGRIDKTCHCGMQSHRLAEFLKWSCEEEQDPSKVETPPKVLMPTSDLLFNLSDIPSDESSWLLKTFWDFLENRYGGWSLPSTSPEAQEFLGKYQGTQANVLIWFNTAGYHALPSYTSATHNAMMRAILSQQSRPGLNLDPAAFGLSTLAQGLRVAANQIWDPSVMEIISNYGTALLIVVSLSFLPCSIVPYLVTERSRCEKQVQLVAGVSKATYWFVANVWDNMVLMAYVATVCLVLVCFDATAFTAKRNLEATVLLMILYCLASIAIVYNLEKLFRDPNIAQLTILCSLALGGVFTISLSLVLQMLWQVPGMTNFKKIYVKVMLLLPPYALGQGLLDIALNHAVAEAFAPYGVNAYQDPLSLQVVGINVIVLAVEAMAFQITNLAIEYNWIRSKSVQRIWIKLIEVTGLSSFKLCRGKSNKVSDLNMDRVDKLKEDRDVIAEKNRVDGLTANTMTDDEILRISHLRKVFGNGRVAVKDLSVSIVKGECFGLLGLNGAGKSTTFKMLTEEISPTGGSFTLNPSARVGYCPQVDAIDPLLRVGELLQIYSMLLGMPRSQIAQAASEAGSGMGLDPYINALCGNLSGGTKRKLCCALAFLGGPQLILMDEPSSGMDAMTKRLVWKEIKARLRKRRVSIVLTSHSMEECEALCSRTVIMSEGLFRCLGSPQHIKDKYGKGHIVKLQFINPNGMAKGKQHFLQAFGNQGLDQMSEHNSTLVFRVLHASAGNAASLGPPAAVNMIFKLVLKHSKALGIRNFSIQRTSLDDVFVSFSKDKGKDKETDDN